ncbi:hypothetical protein GPJ56_009996 [Histomonas meleagridis]|uniref:uncharacterized protein n=1 Tax=Histomonas meleagridis TaxID=135588 RepID=UPI00355A7D8F|nr:hypothetical protein GPJ56_009996 [Histomonas meleagridis]KAH0803051.1 hypothetical protein GO595_004144 [Histomonas meleagridis]
MELPTQAGSENTFNAYRKTIKALKDQISILEEQLYEIQDPNENLLEICQILQQEKQELLDENKRLRNEIQRQQIFSNNKFTQEENTNQGESNQITELEKTLQDLQEENQQLTTKIENLESHNEKYAEKIQNLEKQISAYQSRISESKEIEKQYSRMKTEIEALHHHYESIIKGQKDSFDKVSKELEESKSIIHNFLNSDFQPFSNKSESSDVSALKKRNEELIQEIKDLNQELFDSVNNNPEIQALLEERKELKRENNELHERVHVLELQLKGEDQPLLGDGENRNDALPFKKGVYSLFQANEKIDIRNSHEWENLDEDILFEEGEVNPEEDSEEFKDVTVSDSSDEPDQKEFGFKLLDNDLEDEKDDDNGLLIEGDEEDEKE